jgi:hypothetical protein
MRHHFLPTNIPGVSACACGIERMFVVRVVGLRATFRGFALYRFREWRGAPRARGVIRAVGWTSWQSYCPVHIRRKVG